MDFAYDSTRSAYYISSSKGLLAVDSMQVPHFIAYQGKPLMTNDIEYTERGVLAGSKKFGLMKINSTQAIPFIDLSDGLLSNAVEKFKVVNNWIFISTDSGFQIFSKEGKLVKTLSISDGLKSNKIRDFDIDDSFLWILNTYGIQRINLEQLLSPSSTSITPISEVRMYVNDLQFEDEVMEFSSEQNRIRFEVFAPSLDKFKDITYRYRLVGIEDTWNINSYNQNSIEYKSLPAGSYEFQLVLMYKNIEQDRRSIIFSIAKPIWLQWWFLLLVMALFLLLSYWYYSVRLKQQELKARQINENKCF